MDYFLSEIHGINFPSEIHGLFSFRNTRTIFLQKYRPKFRIKNIFLEVCGNHEIMIIFLPKQKNTLKTLCDIFLQKYIIERFPSKIHKYSILTVVVHKPNKNEKNSQDKLTIKFTI